MTGAALPTQSRSHESFVIFSSAAASRLPIVVSAAGRLRPRITLLDNSSLRAETQPLNFEPGGPREIFRKERNLANCNTKVQNAENKRGRLDSARLRGCQCQIIHLLRIKRK